MTQEQTSTRAPKGGISIMGKFYKGGQFLPQYAPNNSKKTQSTRSEYINNNSIAKTNNGTTLYKGDRVIEDKNGFKTVKRGLWYRLNIAS